MIKQLEYQFFNVIEPPNPYYFHQGQNSCSYVAVATFLGVDVQNLIRNPSLEIDSSGWYAQTGVPTAIVSSGDETFRGARSLRITATPGVGGNVYGASYQSRGAESDPGGTNPSPYPNILTNPNSKLYASVWVKGCPGDTLSLQIVPDGAQPGLGTLGQSNPIDSVVANGDWQELRTTWLDRSGNIAIKPSVLSNNASGCNRFYMDSAYLGSQDAQSFDGSSDGATWLGAVNASISQIDQFHSLGPKVYLSDIGLDIFGYEGFGVPPVENLSTTFAKLHGSHYQRQRFLPRILTIQADVQSCNGIGTVSKIRCDLIEKIFGYKFRETCRYDLMLYWQLTDNCCNPISGMFQIPVVYESGLEGSRGHIWSERITLQFSSYEEVFWSDMAESRSEFIPLSPGAVRPNVDGNQPAYPIIQIRTGANPMTFGSLINDIGQVRMSLGVPTVGYAVPANTLILINTNPLNFGVTQTNLLTGVVTNINNQLNYFASNLSEFLLVPGANNLRVDNTDSTLPAGASVIVRWYNQYLSADCAPLYQECRTC